MGDNTENGTADIGNLALSAIAWGCTSVIGCLSRGGPTGVRNYDMLLIS